MSINPLELKKSSIPYKKSQSQQYDTIKANQKNINHNTIQGVLLNNYIKKQNTSNDIANFDRIASSLMIPDEIKPNTNLSDKKQENFNYKKVLKPILLAAVASIGSIGAISMCLNKYSKVMVKQADLVRPEDLARNFNIVEEPHFAMYRALREPNAKNIAGLIGVGLMSGITLSAKNLVEGIREVWVKKQNCDIEHDLQENLIQVETDVFSGKLNVVNTLLTDTTNYFKNVFTNNNTNFKSFLNFKGNEKKDDDDKNKKPSSKKIWLIAALGAVSISGIMLALIKNYHKTLKNLDSFVEKYQDSEIKAKIIEAVNCKDKQKAIKNLTDILKVINAKDETISSNLKKIEGITEKEILNATKSIKDAQIYAKAPEALGGVSEKIQYYCYINEERGHLYNWILNPENKFNKYLFLSFCAISSIGFIAKEAAGAIKEVVVGRENSKCELNLRKNLVDVEIRNFKAKKMSAINPMIDNFIYQLEKGKPKEELKELAENILVEIKNGPPYVYS